MSAIVLQEVMSTESLCVVALQKSLGTPRAGLRVLYAPEVTGVYNAQTHEVLDALVMTDAQRRAFNASGPREISNYLSDLGLSAEQIECVQLAWEKWAAGAVVRDRAKRRWAAAAAVGATLLAAVAAVVLIVRRTSKR